MQENIQKEKSTFLDFDILKEGGTGEPTKASKGQGEKWSKQMCIKNLLDNHSNFTQTLKSEICLYTVCKYFRYVVKAITYNINCSHK